MANKNISRKILLGIEDFRKELEEGVYDGLFQRCFDCESFSKSTCVMKNKFFYREGEFIPEECPCGDFRKAK